MKKHKQSIIPFRGASSKAVVLLLAFILPLLACTQTSPIQTLKVADNTTAFGINLPAGTYIFDSETKKPYQLKKAALSTDNLSTAYLVAEIAVDTGNVSFGGRIIITSTGNSVFVGDGAGENELLSYRRNTAIGTDALNSTTSGEQNVAIGGGALENNITGSKNVAIGTWASYYNTGDENVVVGEEALNRMVAGENNVALGYMAGYHYGSGSSSNTASNNSVLIGSDVRPNAVGETNQIVIGYTATGNGSNTATIGDDNVTTIFAGESGNADVSCRRILQPNNGNSVFIGENAGLNDDLSANKNVFLGYYSGTLNTTGNYNIAVGSQSLYNNLTGSSNTVVGNSALTDNDIGSNNTAIGSGALSQNTVGNYNTAIGSNAISANSIGVNNTALGYRSLYSTGGDNNTAVGYQAGLNNMGSDNVFLGYQAGYSETGSAKLYISNSNTANPLIKGDFNLSTVVINGALSTTGNFSTNGAATIADDIYANASIEVSQNINVDGYSKAAQYKLSALNTAPASATATGTLGEIRVTSIAIYICTATNTWVKADLTTW